MSVFRKVFTVLGILIGLFPTVLVGSIECNYEYHNHGAVTRSVQNAKKLVNNSPNNNRRPPIEERIAVMILFSSGVHAHNNRMEYLRCAIGKIQTNLMKHTPMDVFVWARNTSTKSVHKHLPWYNSSAFPHIHFMEIEPETWKVPCNLTDDSKWEVRKHFNVDYYLMGRWRLTFSLDFARAMGYKYHAQIDDDLLINKPVNYNLIDKMRQPPPELKLPPYKPGEIGHHKLAVSADDNYEPHSVTLGLAELVTYWMKIRRFKPKGPLYQNVWPKDHSGMTSEWGWNRHCYPGFFMVWSVDFWFQDELQDFITTVFRNGADIEQRWQEQAVMNMMRLVFIPANEVYIAGDIDMFHDRKNRDKFVELCVTPGYASAVIRGDGNP